MEELHEAEELDLHGEDLALEGMGDCEVALALGKEIGDLVVEVLDLALAEEDELEVHADGLLVVVLGL